MNKMVLLGVLAGGMVLAPFLAPGEGREEKENKKTPPPVRKEGFRPPPPGMRPGRGPDPGRGHHMRRGPGKRHGHFFSRFTPEERAALRMLIRKKDHAGFQKKMRELRIKYASPEDRKVMELREIYHKAKTPAEKTSIKDALKKAVRVQMERRLDFMKAQIRSAEEKLNRLKKFYEHNLAEKEKMVEKRTEFFCKHPSDRPMPPFHGKRVPPPGGENR